MLTQTELDELGARGIRFQRKYRRLLVVVVGGMFVLTESVTWWVAVGLLLGGYVLIEMARGMKGGLVIGRRLSDERRAWTAPSDDDFA